MPPDGDGELNVIVRDWKVKGETEPRADRTVSTGGYLDQAIPSSKESTFARYQ